MTEVKCFCCQQKKFFDGLPGVIANMREAIEQNEDDRVHVERAIVQDAHAAEKRIDALEDQLKKLIAVQPDKPDRKKYDSFAANVATGPDEELRLRDENNKLRKFVTAIAIEQPSDFATDYIGHWVEGGDLGEVYVIGARKLLGRLDWEES